MEENNYVRKILSGKKTIYIDTASLMETCGLQAFISKYGDYLEETGKAIIVPASVSQELVRHLLSSNTEKAERASVALQIIRDYSNLFCPDKAEFEDEDLDLAFADHDLLVQLSQGRINGSQLLITNDKKLGKDILGLNDLESCHGFHIFVCYLNDYGDLCRCDPHQTAKLDQKPIENTITSPSNYKVAFRSQDRSIPEDRKTTSWGKVLLRGLCCAGLCFASYVIGKNNGNLSHCLSARL